jgi:hypothetical protein
VERQMTSALKGGFRKWIVCPLGSMQLLHWL